MQKIKYLLLLLSLFSFSCVKDNSTTTKVELNDVIISGVESVYNIQIGETLSINPIVSTKHNDDSKLEYVWYKYNISMKFADTISYEKNLSAPIMDVVPGVQCFLVFKITDKTTGVFTSLRTTIYTTAKYSGGIVALTRSGQNVDMAFLKTEDGELINNMFSTLNPDVKLSPKSDRIFYVDHVPTKSDTFRRVVIATNDENIGVVLDPEILTKKQYLSEMFLLPLEKGKDHHLTHYTNDNGNEILVVDGQLYDRLANIDVESSKFNPAVVSINSPNYRFSPVSMHTYGDYGSPTFFDNATGQFLAYREGNLVALIEGPNILFTHFDPTDMAGYELVAAGTTSVVSEESISDWYSLLKDKTTQNYRMVSFYSQIIDYVKNYQTLWTREISRNECPMLYQATQIIGGDRINPETKSPWRYYSTGFQGMMFFLANNNVYVYNVATGSELKLIDGAASGFTINKIIICKTAYLTSDNQIAYKPRLGLCIQDNAAATNKGGVAYYRINILGGISAQQYFKKTGFCDEVIDFTEKLN